MSGPGCAAARPSTPLSRRTNRPRERCGHPGLQSATPEMPRLQSEGLSRGSIHLPRISPAGTMISRPSSPTICRTPSSSCYQASCSPTMTTGRRCSTCGACLLQCGLAEARGATHAQRAPAKERPHPVLSVQDSQPFSARSAFIARCGWHARVARRASAPRPSAHATRDARRPDDLD